MKAVMVRCDYPRFLWPLLFSDQKIIKQERAKLTCVAVSIFCSFDVSNKFRVCRSLITDLIDKELARQQGA